MPPGVEGLNSFQRFLIELSDELHKRVPSRRAADARGRGRGRLALPGITSGLKPHCTHRNVFSSANYEG
ncbi:hypothetical protein ACFYWN_40875 [Streptomyces sp. NPDC002917]|uniref:hypothetical protein n=1 Tax=Streptomyces sp. NPDC002917 TaxID=3364671 RepID=UPI0036A1D889